MKTRGQKTSGFLTSDCTSKSLSGVIRWGTFLWIDDSVTFVKLQKTLSNSLSLKFRKVIRKYHVAESEREIFTVQRNQSPTFVFSVSVQRELNFYQNQRRPHWDSTFTVQALIIMDEKPLFEVSEVRWPKVFIRNNHLILWETDQNDEACFGMFTEFLILFAFATTVTKTRLWYKQLHEEKIT